MRLPRSVCVCVRAFVHACMDESLDTKDACVSSQIRTHTLRVRVSLGLGLGLHYNINTSQRFTWKAGASRHCE